MMLRQLLENLTTGDLAIAGLTSGAGGTFASYVASHGLVGPLVSFALFVLTTAARAFLNARARRRAPALLTPAQVASLIEELQGRGVIARLDGQGQLGQLIREKVNGQENR